MTDAAGDGNDDVYLVDYDDDDVANEDEDEKVAHEDEEDEHEEDEYRDEEDMTSDGSAMATINEHFYQCGQTVGIEIESQAPRVVCEGRRI